MIPTTRWGDVARALLIFELLLAAGGLVLASSACSPPSRPHILLILADDLGFSDVGVYGGEIRTPNLDALAREGILFTRFHNSGKCGPTRAELMSGLYYPRTRKMAIRPFATIAELLHGAGYATSMVGKWHLPSTPNERGFEHFYGFLGGAINYFTGRDLAGPPALLLDGETVEVDEKTFYTTDAFTDRAIAFIDEALASGRPFFQYVAYNAPHAPLQAPRADIERTRGRFDEGWDALRAARHDRALRSGVLPPETRLTPRDASVRAWDELDPEDRAQEARSMEVYAAVVERLDRNVGRLLAHLERTGIADDTLVIFLSDNGGSPQVATHAVGRPGSRRSYLNYGVAWANVSNSPFRLYKVWSHEGGTATPMIVRWPARQERRGARSDFVGHVVDLMPTLLEVAGVDYPERHLGRRLPPPDGTSLVPALGGDAEPRAGPLFWEFLGNRAVRSGDWKLVAERARGWELYDMSRDRSELDDRARSERDRVAELGAIYDDWAREVGAYTDADARALPEIDQRSCGGCGTGSFRGFGSASGSR